MYQEISGQVKTPTSNRPVSEGEIFVMMQGEGGGFVSTTTDGNGMFVVQYLDFPDCTSFYIRASDKDGRDNVKLTVASESFPASVYAQPSPLSKSL